MIPLYSKAALADDWIFSIYVDCNPIILFYFLLSTEIHFVLTNIYRQDIHTFFNFLTLHDATYQLLKQKSIKWIVQKVVITKETKRINSLI